MKDLPTLIQEFKTIKEHTAVLNFPNLFDEKLLEIFKLGTPQIIEELLLCLDDEFEYAELMFNIIHTVEAFDTAIYVERVLQNLEQLYTTAPEWASTIHFRILNATPTFNAYRNALKKADLKNKHTLNILLNKMIEEEEDVERAKKIRLLLTDIQ